MFRTVTLPGPAAGARVGAASVVFLFCATPFGVVLTLGGLRYSSVETEIYLLTTQLLDLQAAAALSILQLLAITGLLVAGRPARVRARPDRRASYGAAAAAPAGRTPAMLALTLLVLVLVAAPILTLVVGSLRADDALDASANYRALDHRRRGQRAAGPGHRRAGHLAADRGRRDLDVAAARRD